MVKLLLRDLDVTYVTVSPACLRLYSKHPVHMRGCRIWSYDKLKTTWVREQTDKALNHEGERTMAERAASWKVQANTVLDVRPELEQGGEPFVRIMEAASAIKPGETLVIIAPFEPVPLYDVLGARGFSHETEKVAADEWMVQFTRS